MYSRQSLDTPPPTSQFRRPWSPGPFDPLPPMRSSRNDQPTFDPYVPDENNYNFDHDYSRYPRPSQRREPSDASVEALDLADYARTLRPHSQPIDNDYLDPHRPPSLISRVDALSSTTHTSSRGRSTRRPFSLPPHSHSFSSAHGPSSYRSHNIPDEVDIAQFPSWSREWYNFGARGRTSSPDIYTPLPPSQFSSKKRSPFDPGNTLKHSDYYEFSPPHSTLSHSNRFGYSSLGGLDSVGRDYLPWSSDPLEHGQNIDDDVKEERIRMLEREFGPNAQSKNSQEDGDFLDENGKPLVGTVDKKGYLVTQGPKKRTAMRAAQIFCALAAAIPSIYAALVIKTKETPPPAGKPAAYVLYVVSVITVIGLLFLFMFYPCCCRRRKRGPAGTEAANNPLANGMMVLPVQGLPGGKKNKKKVGKGKKGKGGMMMPGGDVQVNLIVDPNIFGGKREESEDEDEEQGNDWDWERGSSSMPGGYNNGNRRKKRRAKRRSVFAGLAMEEEWKKARKWAKQITVVDSVCALIWGAVFVFILLGKRCPSGGFDGWCNAYNVSSAAACLLCVAFCISIFFDIKDLHTSKVSPRTRM